MIMIYETFYHVRFEINKHFFFLPGQVNTLLNPKRH